ncbi:sodium channel protein Nach-like [Teleopsis dalmanni]|uniref:sodium channel protein Nach-like n=1 Tax=Teleopsis dalmanni TaxID=139649 RepID=UPI0018CE0697|nr:sodium channel protein Nach-like [Teleopsis dalmanni]
MSSLKFRATVVDIKSTSNAVWWIKNPTETWMRGIRHKQQSQRKQSEHASLCHDLADLFRNISLHGYANLIITQHSVWEKLIWLAVHATTLFALLTVLLLTWEQFVAQYFAINLHDPLYAVENVPFPAVSICSNNRISQQEAMTYANQLHKSDPSNRSVVYFLESIQLLNNLYVKHGETINTEALTNFQAFLDTHDAWNNDAFYDTRRFMRMLAPACKNFILECKLAEKNIECFSKVAFEESLTMFGPCCTFNLNDSYKQRNYTTRFASPDTGLTVVLNNTVDRETFGAILDIDGYIVMLHRPNDYADISSGSTQLVFPTHNSESFLSINARLFDADDALRSYSPKTRKCAFNDEATNSEIILRDAYSFANCISRCRINSIIALCRCLPFYMPLDLVDRIDGVVYCNLIHVSCLRRYNFKWRNVLTKRETIPGLEREAEEALYCPQCEPSCYDVQYQVSLMSLPIERYQVELE